MHLECTDIHCPANHARKTAAALIGREQRIGKTAINRRTAWDKCDRLRWATVVFEQRLIVRVELETGIRDSQLIACTVNPSVSNSRAYQIVAGGIHRRISTGAWI